jgi:hypothetical protein
MDSLRACTLCHRNTLRLHNALLTAGIHDLIGFAPHLNLLIILKQHISGFMGPRHMYLVLQSPISEVKSPREGLCQVPLCQLEQSGGFSASTSYESYWSTSYRSDTSCTEYGCDVSKRLCSVNKDNSNTTPRRLRSLTFV